MPEGEELDLLIKKLVNCSDKDEQKAAYRAWAEHYDADLDRKQYVAPNIAVNVLLSRLSYRESTIYDAGCGTGKVGALLADAGFHRVTGADFSSEMLKFANLGGHYEALVEADYTQAIELPSDSFDAAISVGVFSREFTGVFLDELVRIVKPGGLVVLTCRPVHFDGYAAKDIERLSRENRIESINKQLDIYMHEGESQAWYLSFVVS